MGALKFKISFVLAVLLFVGCKSISKISENDEYQNKELVREKPLVLPQGLKKTSMENYYPVPKPRVDDGRVAAKHLTLPPGSNL